MAEVVGSQFKKQGQPQKAVGITVGAGSGFSLIFRSVVGALRKALVVKNRANSMFFQVCNQLGAHFERGAFHVKNMPVLLGVLGYNG